MLVERNSGSIEVASKLGFGTTVTIFLPREDRSPEVHNPSS
jgi:signal transduction histidine kinase